ncbi:MAG: insulinase family protein [Opitutaceae bacterium]
MKHICGLLLLFLTALSVTSTGVAETSGPGVLSPTEPWSLENVEIKSSPQVTWGRLENGLRYAIMPHASPPGRVSMRLLVTAGSLNENDDERGYAHFVEHMAFNGTKHFPAGELVRFLQRQGAAYGPNVSANTYRTRTLYKLDLPDNSAATLETGLRIFRDYADGILFEPAEVKRERGVILAEERSGHTSDDARRLALTDLLYAGTLIPDRHPIGLTSLIEHADSAKLRKFHDAWYRPELMCVVIVGQIDSAQVEALVRAQFASLAARGPARVIPALGTIKTTAEPVVATHIRQQAGFHISLFQVAPRAAIQAPTWGLKLEDMRLYSAFDMLTRRLERLTQSSNRIISGSYASTNNEYGRFRILTVTVASSADNWEKAMAIVEQEVRSVIEHGFNQDELVLQQSAQRSACLAMASSLATVPSSELSEEIADSLENDTPFALKGETLDKALAMTDRLTTEDCQRAFRDYWGEQAPHILIETTAELMPSADKVRASYAASRSIAVDAATPVAATVFGYEDFGSAGEVVEKTHVADLDLWLVRFANGVRLNIKRTPFESDLARFNVRIGTGSLSEPADKPGLRLWVGEWLFGGVGKHSLGELNRIMDGFDSLDARVDDDALILSGNSRSEHLPRALRELTALIADPAFRPEGHQEMAANLHSKVDPLWGTPEGPVQRFILPLLAGNNQRVGVPDPEAIYARTSEELRAWLKPQLESGAIEVAVVGDIKVDAVIAEVAKTFGTLPVRQPKPALEAERKLQFPQKSISTFAYYIGSADRPSTLEFFWPMRDSLNAVERRRLPMLALIIADRVREQVREKKGATYSPTANFFSSDTFPGLAWIRCTLEVKPQEAVQHGDAVRDLVAKLAKKGITRDELTRAKAQCSAAIKGWKTDNAFWVGNVLADAQERPVRLDDLRSAETDISQTSVADLNALARSYLVSDQIIRYIIDSNARMPKQK